MKIYNQKGVTLFELVLAVAIIALFSAVLAPSYIANKKTKAISLAKTQISNNIRMVQNYTLSGRAQNGSYPVGGYGIHFMEAGGSNTGKTYFVFADSNPNGFYDNSDVIVENIDLPSGITVTSLSLTPSSYSVHYNAVDYICFPPYGKTRIDGTDAITSVVINISNGSRTETLTLSSSGSVQ